MYDTMTNSVVNALFVFFFLYMNSEKKNCTRQNMQPPFAVLRRLCAWGSKSNQVDMVRELQKLLQKMYPDEYRQHLGFKYYLAR